VAVVDALATGVRHARWNLTAKAAASVCARMVIGVATRLPTPTDFQPIAGDWPPYDDNCRGFIWNPSGHVIGLLLAAFELSYRGHFGLAKALHAVNLLQAVRLISLQQHYTVDVITALGVAFYVDQAIERHLSTRVDKIDTMHHSDHSENGGGDSTNASRPCKLQFRIEPSGTIATATLLWDKAPRTCRAIVDSLPFTSHCFHGRNSGAEALLLTPKVISHLPQDETENGTTEHRLGDVLFGFERAGSCHGGAAANWSSSGGGGGGDVSEIAWIYGHAAQACFWVKDNSTGYRREVACLNRFAEMDGEPKGFYAESAGLQQTGRREIIVTSIC
jgi:hypothetical protein